MNPPPPDLPPPTGPASLPPPNLPAPNLPPPADHAPEVVVSKFTQAPVSIAPATKKAEDEIPDRPQLSPGQLFENAKTWPWKPGQPPFLKVGLGLAAAMGIAHFIPLAGLVISIVVAVYVGDYFYRIVHNTLEGSDVLPAWPKLNEPVEDLIRPGVRITSAALVSMIPVILVHLSSDSHVGVNPVAELSAMLIGGVYFPFAAMMIVFQERFGACWPHLVIPAFMRCLPGAKAAIGINVATFVGAWLLRHIPVAGAFLAPAAHIIGWVMLARALGLLAAQHRKSLSELH